MRGTRRPTSTGPGPRRAAWLRVWNQQQDYLKWMTILRDRSPKFRLLAYKIRVLGTHRPLRGSPLSAWAYRAEASHDDDALQQPVWSCPHAHETPQLAQSCGQEWLLMNQTQEKAAS